MQRVNPKYILRNWMAQEAIDLAQAGDYGAVRRMRQMLAQPFATQQVPAQYALPASGKSAGIAVSCSS